MLNHNWLLVKLGFSHNFRLKLGFSEFKLFLLKKNILIIFGYDKQFLKNFITLVKSFRRFDSYKLKGFFFFDEFPKLKSGKKEQI
jgi:ribosomal protein L6P/L9E